MEAESKASNDHINLNLNHDFFFDAPNHFIDNSSWDDEDFPFFDCPDQQHQEQQQHQQESIPSSTISQLEEEKFEETTDNLSTQHNISGNDQIDQIDVQNQVSNQTVSANDSNVSSSSQRHRRNRVLGALRTRDRSSSSQVLETSRNTNPLDTHSYSSSFLVLLAGLIIKAIGFQVHLLVGFVSFPIWIMYCVFTFMFNPYGTLRRAKDGIFDRFYRVWSFCTESCGNFFFEKLKVPNIALRFGWGFICSVYICFVLFGLLLGGFVIGGLAMRYLVEEPIHMVKSLNFDYTKTTPVALVPIVSCPSSYSDGKYQDDVVKSMVHHVLPPNHKLELTISLMMPESEYNQRLGVFQVRVDFLSENGEVTVSSRYPSMLRFKSHLIHYLETFLKSVPLLAGYASEAQVLHIQMKGLTEGYKPTSCIRVVLEQRAEYSSGAGIPEIYSASMLLESELPLFKRILWYWRKTIFIWTSMVLFTMEVMTILLCCRPVLIPRARPRDGSSTSNAPQSTVAQTANS